MTPIPALQIDPDREQQLTIYGSQHQLTVQQHRCLVTLALQPQRVIHQDRLYRAIWGHEIVEPANLATIISHLRKLGVPIVTATGRGYMLQLPPDQVKVHTSLSPPEPRYD